MAKSVAERNFGSQIRTLGYGVDESGEPSVQRTADGAALVRTLAEADGVVTLGEDNDVTTTRKAPATQPTAAKAVRIGFYNDGSAVAKYLYVVFNALSDGDANTKLGDSTTRFPIVLGKERAWGFPSNGLCTRIDWASDTASETGSNKVFWEYIS